MAADHQSSLPGVCAAAFAGRPPLNRQCCCQSREFVLRRQIASKKDNGSSTPLLLEFLIGLPNLSTPLVCRNFFVEVAGEPKCYAAAFGLLPDIAIRCSRWSSSQKPMIASRRCRTPEAADEQEAHHSMEQPPKRETFALVRGAAGSWASIGVDKLEQINGKSLAQPSTSTCCLSY
nr:hypothetical protein Iba_chr03fCG1080 [Ipomoea batatas]